MYEEKKNYGKFWKIVRFQEDLWGRREREREARDRERKRERDILRCMNGIFFFVGKVGDEAKNNKMSQILEIFKTGGEKY